MKIKTVNEQSKFLSQLNRKVDSFLFEICDGSHFSRNPLSLEIMEWTTGEHTLCKEVLRNGMVGYYLDRKKISFKHYKDLLKIK
jgi:hypothetical protein